MRASAISAIALVAIVYLIGAFAPAQSPTQSDADFATYATKLRESALLHMEPQIIIPNSTKIDAGGHYPWKTEIVTTVFWIGAGGKAMTGASAWDPKWERHYGGFDNPNPAARHNFVPAAFVPRLNPFYVALPYNDVAKGSTKPEAKVVIPWFRELVDHGTWAEGQSVCRDRWIAIRNNAGKICYAQWSDCGPFGGDHWQYVFGNEKPRPNANGGAGLNVSPAVRDYLELSSTDATDWKFVDQNTVPSGPWALYGENNPLTAKQRAPEQLAGHAPSPPSPQTPAPETPTPVLRQPPP